jgi:hypothetical protein
MSVPSFLFSDCRDFAFFESPAVFASVSDHRSENEAGVLHRPASGLNLNR